tara:strand:- start:334 stop:1377 length:1044 start_codon:yes stop_codon:yes gene_type:complete
MAYEFGDKKWSEMSEEERAASGGSRSDHMAKRDDIKARAEAKERAQTHSAQPQPSAQTPAQPAQNSQPAVNKGTGPNNHYSAADNLSPIEQQMIDRKNQEKAYADKKSSGFEQASAYLAQGNSRDAEFDRILKESGTNNSEYQKNLEAQRKQNYEANQQARKDENAAYQQSRRDMKEFRESSSASPVRNVDRSAYYLNQKETGGIGGGQAHQNAVNQLLATGQKFTHLDVQREMGSASTHNQESLYKPYGGIDNYMENYSVGSGNWRSQAPQNEITTMKEADDQQRKYFKEQSSFFSSPDWLNKYGQYDWAKKQQENLQNQQSRFTTSFDNRQERLQGTAEGRSLGY